MPCPFISMGANPEGDGGDHPPKDFDLSPNKSMLPSPQ